MTSNNEKNGALGPAPASPVYYNATMAFPFLFVASVTLMVQASQHCIDRNKAYSYFYDEEHCVKQWAYGVAAGTVSTGLLLILIALQKFGCSDAATNAKPYLACFLLLWWLIATAVLTFDTPYLYTGNGYFACWVGTIAAYIWASDCCASLKQHANKATTAMTSSAVAIVLVASVVELVAAVVACDNSNSCKDERGYAVAVGAVSAFICLVAMFTPQLHKPLSLLLFVWWIPGVYVLTFSSYAGSFASLTGNGYFASWAAMIYSAGFFMSQWTPETELGLPVTQPTSRGP
jgi:hypothetical protein